MQLVHPLTATIAPLNSSSAATVAVGSAKCGAIAASLNNFSYSNHSPNSPNLRKTQNYRFVKYEKNLYHRQIAKISGRVL